MKLNIIFDGNFLMHKTKSIWMTYGKEASLTEALKTKEARAEFMRKVITDFCFTANQILQNSINLELNSIVVVFDKDDSWRKQIYPEYKFKEKGDGSEDEGKKYFYEVMEKFKNLIDKRGITTIDISGLEGDDLCWIVSKELKCSTGNIFHKKLNEAKNVIVTADRDIVQCVTKETTVFNNNSKMLKLYSTEGSQQFLFFKKLDINHIQVEPKEYLFKKILLGDAGDNIPNVLRGMGEKKVDSIAALVKSLDLLQCDFQDEEYLEKITIIVNSQFNNKHDEVELKAKIIRNAKLIQINQHTIPKGLLKEAVTAFITKKDRYCYEGELSLSRILKQE